MGGLGPGIGGMEYVVIAIVALLVVGPERLPMLLRKVGQLVAKARNMANEFRASFDEMARQSELDDLRKEVEALRTHQGIHALGADAEAAFKDIKVDLNSPLGASSPSDASLPEGPLPDMLAAPDEWPDNPPVLESLDESAVETVVAKPKRAKAKTTARTPAKKAASVKKRDGSSKPVRARKVDL
jgi:sec-independent protein translocase protein TatB